MASAKLSIAVPSKGRLKDQAADLFERAGLALRKTGHDRLYRGGIKGLDGVEVVYLSAAEIVHQLKAGRVQLGITGEDLIRETLADVDGSVEFLAPLALAGPIWWWRSRIAGSTSRAWLTSRMSPHNSPVRTAAASASPQNI
jgi:hypothetical protein